MIEIKLSELRNPQFSQAYQKLMTTSGLDPRVAYHIAKLGTDLEKELATANEAHDKLVQQWGTLTEEEGGKKFWKIPDEKVTDWAEANRSFHEAVVDIPRRPIFLAQIEKAGLSPVDFLALEPVISDAQLQLLEGSMTDEITMQNQDN